MKKSKLVTCLSAAFVSAMALLSCNASLKSKSGVILTIDGVPYTAEDLFNDQKTPAAAEAKFNAVYKVAVRNFFVNGEGKSEMDEITRNTKIKIKEQKALAQSNADKNGTSYEEEWNKILDSNGVDNESGLYDKFEYDLQKEKFENRFYDDHYDALRKGNKFPGLPEEDPEGKYKFTSYLEGKQPYHIKHILVKLGDGAKAGDGVNAEITAEAAKKIGSLIRLLANGYSFESLAANKNFNDDESARNNKGSLGIMSRDTSFVNDFKLGIYMYESFYGSSTQESQGTYDATVAKTALGLDNGSKAAGYADKISKLADPSTFDGENYHGIGQIPYEAALNLEKYANYDFGDSQDAQKVKERFRRDGVDTSKVAAKYLPRNVIFNKYFNKHNIMVITPRKTHNYEEKVTTTGKEQNGNLTDWLSATNNFKTRNANPDKYLGVHNSTGTDPYTDLKGFAKFANTPKNMDAIPKMNDEGGTSTSSDIALRDENGRIILVFRSGTGGSSSSNEDTGYQGVHFVVIERSPFIGKESETYVEASSGQTKTGETTLEDYYTVYYPKQTTGSTAKEKNHPVYGDWDSGNRDWKKTFVNYFPYLESPEFSQRADTVKSELKKASSKLNTYLYQYLVTSGEIVFNPEMKEKYHIDIEGDIDNWIKISRATDEVEQKRTWDDTWEEYYYSLQAQTEQRAEYPDKETGATRIYSKLIPEACLYSFISDDFDTYDPNPSAEGDEVRVTLKELFGEGGVFHE